MITTIICHRLATLQIIVSYRTSVDGHIITNFYRVLSLMMKGGVVDKQISYMILINWGTLDHASRAPQCSITFKNDLKWSIAHYNQRCEWWSIPFLLLNKHALSQIDSNQWSHSLWSWLTPMVSLII